MSDTVITAIISATCSITIAVITAIIAPLVLKDRGKKSDGAEGLPRSKSKVIRWLVATGLVIGAVLGYFLAIRIIHPSCLPLAPTYVTITSPASGSTVPRTIPVRGTSCHIQNGQELWIFLKPDEDIHYYPNHDPATISSDDTWSATLTIGPQNPHGEGFEVFAVLADQEKSAIIKRTASDPSFPGFETLPDEIHVTSQVHVILQ